MSWMKHYALDTRTCGEADEDARLDRRDGLTSRKANAHARQSRLLALMRSGKTMTEALKIVDKEAK